MENIDKGLIVPKWVLINQTKLPQMPQNLSAQAQNFGVSMKKDFIGHPLSVFLTQWGQNIYLADFEFLYLFKF